MFQLRKAVLILEFYIKKEMHENEVSSYRKAYPSGNASQVENRSVLVTNRHFP